MGRGPDPRVIFISVNFFGIFMWCLSLTTDFGNPNNTRHILLPGVRLRIRSERWEYRVDPARPCITRCKLASEFRRHFFDLP